MMKVIKPAPITDSVLVSTTATDATGAYNAATNYALGARAQSGHVIYESVAANNLNHPVTDELWWVRVSSTNEWAMFDAEVGSQTQAADSLTVVLAPGYIDSLALLELQAASVTVTVTDGAGGPQVYTRTISLVDGAQLADWYEYFFSAIEERHEALMLDLPPYYNARVTIAITGAGAVLCGACVLGSAFELGGIQPGASAGIIDFSRKEKNEFGTTVLVERAYANRMALNLAVDPGRITLVKRRLAELRATPAVWIGSEDPLYALFVVYGYYRDFNLEMPYPTLAFCSLEIEGLI